MAKSEARDSSPVFVNFVAAFASWFIFRLLPNGKQLSYTAWFISSRGKAYLLVKRTSDGIGTSFTCRVHLSAHRH